MNTYIEAKWSENKKLHLEICFKKYWKMGKTLGKSGNFEKVGTVES